MTSTPRSVGSANTVEKIAHCTGSVSWNSSTSPTVKRRRMPSATGSPMGLVGQPIGQPAQQVVVGVQPHEGGATQRFMMGLDRKP